MSTETIDWKKVKKLANKTGVFKGHFNPLEHNSFITNWSVIMSTRNAEKTTGYILLAMLIYEVTGTRIEYCRLDKDDMRPKVHNHFFDSILDLKYIERITGGKWNSIVYKAGFWYYRNVDENGTQTSISETALMHCFAIRDAMKLKSNYTSDSLFLIFDEFEDITKRWQGDEFVLLCDCVSTIFRNRTNAHINLLGNTLNMHSPWFNELCISRHMSDMHQGTSKICNQNNDLLTPVFVSILPAQISEKKKKINSAFFNFLNPKLEAITGTSGGWSMRLYQKLPKGEKTTITNNIYVNCEGFLIRIDLMYVEGLGACANVVPTYVVELPDDAIELTTEPITNERQIYLMRCSKIGEIIVKLYRKNKIYYATNEAGNLFDNFLVKSGVTRL